MSNLVDVSKIALFFIILFSFAACGEKAVPSPVELIAHAGGGVDVPYTNSREALEQSIADGYRYIEFDLQFTADSVLVAAHDWDFFNLHTGCAQKGDTAPTFADFSSRRMAGRYTPLSADEINSVFESDTTLYLVTDKISSPAILARYFPRLKNRMVVEAFSYDDYTALRNEGYFRVLYSCMAADIFEVLVKQLFYPLFDVKIEWFTMYVGELDNIAFRLVDRFSSFDIALFTVNDYAELVPDDFCDIGRVKMIYTDRIKP